MKFRVNVLNLGHANASDVSIKFRDDFANSPSKIPRNTTCSKVKFAPEQADIYPNDLTHPRGFDFVSDGSDPYDLDQRDIGIDQDVIDGKKVYYVQGCIAYKTFDTIASSAFCFYFRYDRSNTENPVGFISCYELPAEQRKDNAN